MASVEHTSGFNRTLPTAVGLFAALGLPVLLPWLGLPGGALWSAVRAWGVALVVLTLVLFWERLPLRSIGLRPVSWGDVLWGLGGFVLGLVAFGLAIPLVRALGLETDAARGIARLAALPVGLRVFLVLTAGITEEILYRGYPIERLSALTGSSAQGAVLTYVVFVGLHTPFWGVGGAIQIGAWSLVVTALYVWRRNLVSCMIMHVLNDAYAFLLLPLLIPLPS